MRQKEKLFYGWIIVFLSLAIMTIGYLVYSSWSVFYVALLKEYGWTRAATAIIFSISSIVYGLGSAIAGFLFDRFGPRKLFTTGAILIAIGAVGCSRSNELWQFSFFFGILVGFGTCSVGFVPNLALVSHWFEKRRGTALGISTVGARDTFALLPLIQIAIIALGWRNAYLVLAASTAIFVIPLSRLLRTKPQDMGLLPDGEVKAKKDKETVSSIKKDVHIVDTEWTSIQWTLPRAMQTYRFWTIFFLYFCGAIMFTALISHFVALVTDFGFTALFAANLMLIYAISTIAGRLFGFISDLLGRELAYTLSIAFMLLPMPILLFTRDTSASWLLYIFVVIFGLGSGLNTPALSAAFADLFQGEKFGTIIGTANIGYGLGASLGTWFFGYVFDISGTYNPAIVATMIILCLMAIGVWVAAPRKVWRVAKSAAQTRSI